jgi:hypothetical protein
MSVTATASCTHRRLFVSTARTGLEDWRFMVEKVNASDWKTMSFSDHGLPIMNECRSFSGGRGRVLGLTFIFC